MVMKQITLNIPENKYDFFMELIKNLGLEKAKEKPTNRNEVKEPKATLASLRGKLHLTIEQYDDFHQQVNDSRNEWSRNT